MLLINILIGTSIVFTSIAHLILWALNNNFLPLKRSKWSRSRAERHCCKILPQSGIVTVIPEKRSFRANNPSITQLLWLAWAYRVTDLLMCRHRCRSIFIVNQELTLAAFCQVARWSKMGSPHHTFLIIADWALLYARDEAITAAATGAQWGWGNTCAISPDQTTERWTEGCEMQISSRVSNHKSLSRSSSLRRSI